MTTKEAAALWGCGWQTVKRLVRAGRIEGAYKVGYTWVIPDGAQRPPALSRARHDWARRRGEEPAAAPAGPDRAALRAQAADQLAGILTENPDAEWARFALEVVLKQPAEGL